MGHIIMPRHQERGVQPGMACQKHQGTFATTWTSSQSHLADSSSGGLGADGSAPRGCGHSDQCSEECVADTEVSTIRTGLCQEKQGQVRRGRFGDLPSGLWDDYTWVRCADNKFRRAPHNLVGVADGLSDGVPATLGKEEGQTTTWPSPTVMGNCERDGLRPSRIATGRTGGYITEVMPNIESQVHVPNFHRSILAALGNSIVWRVAMEIMKAIKQAHERG